MGRLDGKTAVICGAGQTPGQTIGNGRAMAVLFAREGARVLCVDRVAERAQETVDMIAAEGGQAYAQAANIAKAEGAEAVIAAAGETLGGLDILVNNVGIGGGDGPAHKVEEDAFDRILAVNLKGAWLTSKAAIPVMRAQGGGAIVNISSLASIAGGTQVAYEVSKAAMNRLTTSIAQSNAKYGVRCNAILPGLMDTPMAVAGIAQATGQDVEAVREARGARVPLGGKMGTAWDTAYAALFLASHEAAFITGVLLPVDGGMSSRIG
ncbi:MAG: SDR family NAD(P)-dependent oxidoreductase [Phenylobacterium sp.]|uniref:SDR family NAD(P)-dependent oxidoreductase n=1 Tax=Phenylobacterium sp. TaxID=1871053 RepID=UPI00271A1623|nr:SDR family NAD(P)-dependent oxidoreductase [Phenylobacterium sp.]MDO8412045.1 SDR family NAD(P)-dependent oxidoreductase [Phenylobacterium sp.]